MSYLIIIPIALALLQLLTHKYVFSALTTLACAALTVQSAPIMAAALAVSAAGDWFMAHKGDREPLYVMGIAGFFIGHILFIVHAAQNMRLVVPGVVTGCVLAAAYMPYLILRVIGKVPKLLKVPVVLYALISITGLTFAVMGGNALYIVGVAFLLFSDTMIAESDFVGNKSTGKLILPTYYLCHILVALSALI